MKTERKFPSIQVTKKQEARLRAGHPWVYDTEITSEIPEIANGSLVDVMNQKNHYLGTGLWSEQSKIRVRLLSANANEVFNDAFFARRTEYALAYREKVMGEDFASCRLIHGEADGLPGVTVDRYGDILAAEVLSYGMEQRKTIIYDALISGLKKRGVTVRGIYERNEGALRQKEGLPLEKGWYVHGMAVPEETVFPITENGIRYMVDVENGQKTGFFLDQKYNRLAVRKMAKGMRVLDCCTHTGAFALNAAAGGAASVTAVDISRRALDLAAENAALNGFDDISFVEADVFEYLESQLKNRAGYDLIILDPPAFTKSRKTFARASSGYQRLNALAMRILPRGGYLVTCSCSHFMHTEDFLEMLQRAAGEAGVSLRLVEERHASPDHPVMLGIDETDYLKFFLLQIV